MRTPLYGLLLVPCISSCEVSASGPPARAARLAAGRSAVLVDEDRGAIELTFDGEVVSVLDPGALALGTVDAVDDAANYDPWGFVGDQPTYAPLGGFAIRGATRFSLDEVRADAVVVSLEHDGGFESSLTISVERDDTFRLELAPRDASQVAWLRYAFAVPESEAFYGLGEVFDHVNHRGLTRAMQLEVDELESANNEAHVPVPFFIGTRGWGFFVESSFPGAFDMAAADPLRVSATFGTGTRSADGLVGHWYAAQHPLDVTRAYYETTGYPELPAEWAHGPLVWRDENDDQAQVEADLATLRDLDLATTGVWIDRPYATGVNTFDFDAPRFPDPDAMLRKARDLGFEVALWHVPYLDEGDPNVAPLVSFAEDAGFYPEQVGLLLNGWGRPLDLTIPEAVSWWQDQLSAYTDAGVLGFKLDYGEDLVPSLLNARNVYRFDDGSDERTMHRDFTLLYHRTYAELLPDGAGMLLCRAGKWGSQTVGPIIVWPGDLDATFWKHRDEVTVDGDPLLAVGGLPASLVAGLSLGPSGFPLYGSDTGGYRHSPPTPEVFRRWFEQTALSSVMQIGTSTNDVAWEFGDDELLASYRFYTRLHLRLFPYLRSLALEVPVTGRPLMIPYGLAFPEEGAHPDDEYLLGPSLLVAPVVEGGVDSRTVRFPAGSWVDFWSGTVIDGPAEYEITAPLGRIPLFLRRGALVPMLRQTIDTLSPTGQPDRVDSLATDPGLLHALLTVGDEPTSTTVFDGATFELTPTDAGFDLGWRDGTRWDRGAVFEIVAAGTTPPSAVRVDGLLLEPSASREAFDLAAQGAYFDPDDRNGTLWVKILGGPDRRVVVEN
jgi:alpha-D-xyloside xylohydrolase